MYLALKWVITLFVWLHSGKITVYELYLMRYSITMSIELQTHNQTYVIKFIIFCNHIMLHLNQPNTS
jgi:hypothetical protein